TTRTLDQSLHRGSRRAVLDQWWTNQSGNNLGQTIVGSQPRGVKSDGADLWVANNGNGSVSRVRASDGSLLQNYSGAVVPFDVLVAMDKVFVTGTTSPGTLYQIDPAQSGGGITTVTNALGAHPEAIAFDGQHIWTANNSLPGSVSIVTLNPLSVSNVSAGFGEPVGILYDGANIWVADFDGNLKQLDSSANILLSVAVGRHPESPVFDGTNIWAPNNGDNTVTVVRAKGGLTGTVLATLSGNGLNKPMAAAFDGERILVTNIGGSSVSLWKA